MNHVVRKPVYAICEQQRRRSACWAGRFESYLVANSQKQVFLWRASYEKFSISSRRGWCQNLTWFVRTTEVPMRRSRVCASPWRSRGLTGIGCTRRANWWYKMSTRGFRNRSKSTSSEKQIIRICNGCKVLIENSVTRVTVWHHQACGVMPNSYPEWRNFQFRTEKPLWIFFICILFLG